MSLMFKLSLVGSRGRLLTVEVEVSDRVPGDHLVSLVFRHAREVSLDKLAGVGPVARRVRKVATP